MEIIGFFPPGVFLMQRKSLILFLSCSKAFHFMTSTKLFIYLKTTQYNSVLLLLLPIYIFKNITRNCKIWNILSLSYSEKSNQVKFSLWDLHINFSFQCSCFFSFHPPFHFSPLISSSSFLQERSSLTAWQRPVPFKCCLYCSTFTDH